MLKCRPLYDYILSSPINCCIRVVLFS